MWRRWTMIIMLSNKVYHISLVQFSACKHCTVIMCPFKPWHRCPLNWIIFAQTPQSTCKTIHPFYLLTHTIVTEELCYLGLL